MTKAMLMDSLMLKTTINFSECLDEGCDWLDEMYISGLQEKAEKALSDQYDMVKPKLLENPPKFYHARPRARALKRREHPHPDAPFVPFFPSYLGLASEIFLPFVHFAAQSKKIMAITQYIEAFSVISIYTNHLKPTNNETNNHYAAVANSADSMRASLR